ncbi:hypothetical protein N7G274_003174 [Stereocaulon virgatum]|uniref:N-acetyltransferase domain-containing protein n=1 Tax=Stereocaulon virgatum TaxID=373712 RepID=A0ABR4AG43_9LECA
MENTLIKPTTSVNDKQRIDTTKYTFRIVRLNATELAQYPKLPQLTTIMNNAFSVTGRKYPGLYNAELKRYDAPTELVEDMGRDGVLFITLATTSEQTDADPRPIATTGYKPWIDTFDLGDKLKASFTVTEYPEQHKTPDDVPRFEIKAVTVDPEFQSQGLASQLFANVTEEIFGGVRSRGGSRVRLMVCTFKEINEGYWTAKGFVKLTEMRFDVGTAGSLTGFSSMDMYRDHCL